MILRLFKWFHTLRHFGFLLSKFLPFYLLAGYFSSGHCDAGRVCVCVCVAGMGNQTQFYHCARSHATGVLIHSIGQILIFVIFSFGRKSPFARRERAVWTTHSHAQSTSNGTENMSVHNLDSDSQSQSAIVRRHRILLLITKCAPKSYRYISAVFIMHT